MAQTLDLSKPHRTIHVGVILLGGETEILDVAPIDLLYGMSKRFVDRMPDAFIRPEFKAQAVDMEFHWVSEAGSSTPSRLTSCISLVPTDSFETCPPLDIVLIGATMIDTHTPTETELAFVRKSWASCSAFVTICGGVEVPLAAGLLEGKTATGPRMMLGQLRERAGNTNWVEKRWAHDGKLWTSGTLLNGVDLMNAFVNEYWGGEESMAAFMTKMGSWPNRDVDYKDAPWSM